MELQENSTREILKKVRRIEIRTRRQVSETMAGAYRSVFKGQGIDFEEVREYMPGDDVRSIDWNVTAKMERPFVKRYREERELTIVLAVDLSASGQFGSTDQSKRELAAELASVLAFSATRNNDKVGLLLFTDHVEKYVPPNKGRQHVLRVIREILFFQPENTGTEIPRTLKYLNRVLKRKAIVFLLSDFLTDETTAWIRPAIPRADSFIKTLRLTNRRHDLVCIELSDPRELELPDVGWLALEDAETGEQIEVDTSNRRLREVYNTVNIKRRESLIQSFKQSGIDHFSVNTNEPYISALRNFFQQRAGRR